MYKLTLFLLDRKYVPFRSVSCKLRIFVFRLSTKTELFLFRVLENIFQPPSEIFVKVFAMFAMSHKSIEFFFHITCLSCLSPRYMARDVSKIKYNESLLLEYQRLKVS